MAFIELQNIHVVKKKETYLQDINMKVQQGEYLALLGPTNSGKTSILNVIAGLLPVTKGTIFMEEKDVTQVPPEDRNVGYVFENYNLFPHMTVMDNLLFGARMKQADLNLARSEAKEILRIMHLEGRENAFPHELSGGMQQRVAIARAVVAGARILLLDEPYRALDAKIREEMRYEIRRIVKTLNLTCIHATHEIEEAMIVADRIAVLNEGRIEQIATPKELFEQPASYYVASTIAENNTYEIKGTLQEALQTKILPDITLNDVMNTQGITLNQDKKSTSYRVLLTIKYSDVSFQEKETTRKKLELDPLSIEEKNDMKNEKNVIISGVITRIRLLGEYIRFTIRLQPQANTQDGDNMEETLIKEIMSKQLLSLELKDAHELLNKEVKVIIPLNKLRVFLEKTASMTP